MEQRRTHENRIACKKNKKNQRVSPSQAFPPHWLTCSQCLRFLKKCFIGGDDIGYEALRPLQVCRGNGSDMEQR
jgi:hypothetical protein